MSTLTCTSAKPWEQAWRATVRLQGRCEREWEQRLFKLNALAAHTATYFLNHGTSLMIAWQGRLRVTVGQQGVRWLQVHAWHDCSCIAWIPLLAHGLTVKLSPCPCSHTIVWLDECNVAACLCGHPKCNMLVAQAHLRMIQHLTSKVTKKFSKWKQVHVGMEPSKTNQTRWEWHHNTFAPPLHLVPLILPTMHPKKLSACT